MNYFPILQKSSTDILKCIHTHKHTMSAGRLSTPKIQVCFLVASKSTYSVHLYLRQRLQVHTGDSEGYILYKCQHLRIAYWVFNLLQDSETQPSQTPCSAFLSLLFAGPTTTEFYLLIRNTSTVLKTHL